MYSSHNSELFLTRMHKSMGNSIIILSINSYHLNSRVKKKWIVRGSTLHGHVSMMLPSLVHSFVSKNEEMQLETYHYASMVELQDILHCRLLDALFLVKLKINAL